MIKILKLSITYVKCQEMLKWFWYVIYARRLIFMQLLHKMWIIIGKTMHNHVNLVMLWRGISQVAFVTQGLMILPAEVTVIPTFYGFLVKKKSLHIPQHLVLANDTSSELLITIGTSTLESIWEMSPTCCSRDFRNLEMQSVPVYKKGLTLFYMGLGLHTLNAQTNMGTCLPSLLVLPSLSPSTNGIMLNNF